MDTENTPQDADARPAVGGPVERMVRPGAEACPTCGSDCNERDEMTKAEREIERLRGALRYQDARDGRIGTHHPSCWSWGHSHYECATAEVERLRSLINRAVAGYATDDAAVPTCVSILREAFGPNAAGNRLAEGKSELTGLLGGPSRSEKE